MTTSDDTCIICGNDYDWHEVHQPRHKFARKGDDGALAQLGPSNKEREAFPGGRQKKQVKLLPGLPTDPTLRVLLLRKGIITADELSETEDEIRRTREEGGIVIVSPAGGNGTPSDGSDSELGHGAST